MKISRIQSFAGGGTEQNRYRGLPGREEQLQRVRAQVFCGAARLY